VVQALYGLPDPAMLDMGDFAGGLLKYLRKNPVPRLTIGGGIGKLVKLSQGALDLHSGRSQVDFARLAATMDAPELAGMNTALQCLEYLGVPLAEAVAQGAKEVVEKQLKGAEITVDVDVDVDVDVVVIDRAGAILARCA